MRSLFEPVLFGPMVLRNRVFMAPLTRNRANADGVPSEFAVQYYAQRASAGLIITEATQISPMGKGYINTPGIHSPEQIVAWRRIVDAVHENCGRIFLQLWHVGRISHSSLLPNNAHPVAPSAILADSQTFVATGRTQVSEPVELTRVGIKETLADYRLAAHNAKEAGFDGVEIHAANGYLIDQFLHTGSNQRRDLYGGTALKRVRFLAEVTEEVLGVWGEKRVGVRVSPTGTFNDMHDENLTETFSAAIEMLDNYRIGYLHVIESTNDGRQNNECDWTLLRRLRELWTGFRIVNGGYDAARGQEAVLTGYADAVAYGRAFLANPDLPRRLRLGVPLNEPDQQTFYGGDARGYTDYPSLSQDSAAH
jgi:N-ethylmaleimide reductase